MYIVEQRGADLLNQALALRVMNESGVDASHLERLFEASKHRQIILANTENGEPLASLGFAKISKYTLRLIAANPSHKLRPYEYHEGKILYVVDGFFKKNGFRKSLSVLSKELKKYRVIAYVRRDRLKIFYYNNGVLRGIMPQSLLETIRD